MKSFLSWDNQADADNSLVAVEALYVLPYSERNGYFMDRWAVVTKSDVANIWGFYKPENRLGKTVSVLMDRIIGDYTEQSERPNDWVTE